MIQPQPGVMGQGQPGFMGQPNFMGQPQPGMGQPMGQNGFYIQQNGYMIQQPGGFTTQQPNGFIPQQQLGQQLGQQGYPQGYIIGQNMNDLQPGQHPVQEQVKTDDLKGSSTSNDDDDEEMSNRLLALQGTAQNGIEETKSVEPEQETDLIRIEPMPHDQNTNKVVEKSERRGKRR